MAWAACEIFGCEHKVRTGLKRPPLIRGVSGQQLADGRRCWRCRVRLARKDLPRKRLKGSK